VGSFPKENAMNHRPALVALAVGALLCVFGCGGTDDPAPAASKKSTPVTLRIATYDAAGVAGGVLVAHFAQAVHDLDPTVTVEPTYEAAPDEEATIKLVQGGGAELGLVATRAWDLVGVDSLRAINSPFLIDSTELLDQVVASDQAAIMMNGLSSAGMTGLAMLPEALRHPFGTETAPMGLDDYQGATIRSPHSKTTWDLLSAFGAKPMFEEDGYTIAESQFDQAPASNATGNVTFYAKADVVALSDAGKKRVSASQLDALTEAAETTRDWAIGTFDDDAAAAATYCKNGGKITGASPAEIAELENKAAPVMADLKGDDSTAAVIAAIEKLKSGITAPAPVTRCVDSSAPQSKASELNGTYHWELTRKALQEAGVTNSAALNDVPVVVTGTLKDGSAHMVSKQTEGSHKGDVDEGHSTYEYDGKRVIFHWSQSPTNCTKAKVTIVADGSLEFSDIVECPEDQAGIVYDQVGMRHWQKIK
jgi:hypothetical protein